MATLSAGSALKALSPQSGPGKGEGETLAVQRDLIRQLQSMNRKQASQVEELQVCDHTCFFVAFLSIPAQVKSPDAGGTV
jgi:hypothetical protein